MLSGSINIICIILAIKRSKNKVKKIKKPASKASFILCGPSRIRTYEGARPADLQSAPVDRFGIDPLNLFHYK